LIFLDEWYTIFCKIGNFFRDRRDSTRELGGAMDRSIRGFQPLRPCAVLLLATFLGAPLRAQTGPSAATLDAELSAFAAPFVDNRDFEGVVLVHRVGGEDVFRPFGPGARAFNPRTPFLVGSIAKTFTAEAVRLLVERGALALADPVRRFLPDLARGDGITIEQLLTHTSGVPDYYQVDDFRTARRRPMPPDSFVSWISRFPLDFEPGQGNSYSNSGFNLLALVVERAGGVSLGAFLEAEVFGPLGMEGAGTVVGSPPGEVPRGLRPIPAPESLGPPLPLHPSWLFGSGSTYATVLDLATWGDDVANRITAGGFRPYGWGVRTAGERRFLVQNGRIPGYAAVLQVHPAEGLVVVVLSRVESDAVARIAEGAATLALGGTATPEVVRVEVPLDAEAARAYAGVYEIGPGFRLTVGGVGGGLGAAAGEGSNLQYGFLQPLGDDRFFFREAYVPVGFTRDDEGNVTGLTWGGGGPYPLLRGAAAGG
jgi:CubicO group peptidase (beta-lactamase class C family)